MKKTIAFLVASYFLAFSSQAAISMDRTRIIFSGDENSVSLTVNNKNMQLPYLAQGWLQNDKDVKITDPFTILPPIQRIDPGKSSQLRIEALASVANLPQDRESLFFFNLREIPPASKKSNVLQIALQTRVKMFYRPKSIVLDSTQMKNAPWQNELVLVKKEGTFYAKNPTPYYIVINSVKKSADSVKNDKFSAMDLAPFSEKNMNIDSVQLGNSPIVTYINDFGGQVDLTFKCSANECRVNKGN